MSRVETSFTGVLPDLTRDDPEADSFDLDLCYVFGSQKQYMADNCNGKLGTVVAQYNVNVQECEIANVVYVHEGSREGKLVLVPTSFFRPSEGLRARLLTNSQRRKRTQNFQMMECVQLGLDINRRVLWITKAARNHRQLDYIDGMIGMLTTGVIKPATEKEGRHLWTEDIGVIPGVPKDILFNYLSNVAFKVQVQLSTQPPLDENALRVETLKLDDFRPTFRFNFLRIESVQDVDQNGAVERAPWNKRPIDVNQLDYEDAYLAMGYEKDIPKSLGSQAIEDVCVVISETELFSVNNQDIPTRTPRRGGNWMELAPGSVVDVRMVYNERNKAFVLISYSLSEFGPLPLEKLPIPDDVSDA